MSKEAYNIIMTRYDFLDAGQVISSNVRTNLNLSTEVLHHFWYE